MRAGGPLLLLTQDPKDRSFWRVPGRFEKEELEDHLVELFPEGLSPHGWRFMLDRYDYTRDPITNDAFVNHTWQVEFTFEMEFAFSILLPGRRDPSEQELSAGCCTRALPSDELCSVEPA